MQNINAPQLITSCGLTALLPDKDELFGVQNFIQYVLRKYNGDLFAIKETYPYHEIKYDEKDNYYYITDIDNEDEDPMEKFYNLFHVYYWKQMESEVWSRAFVLLKLYQEPESEILKSVRDYLDKRTKTYREKMTMQNMPNMMASGIPVRQFKPMEVSNMMWYTPDINQVRSTQQKTSVDPSAGLWQMAREKENALDGMNYVGDYHFKVDENILKIIQDHPNKRYGFGMGNNAYNIGMHGMYNVPQQPGCRMYGNFVPTMAQPQTNIFESLVNKNPKNELEEDSIDLYKLSKEAEKRKQDTNVYDTTEDGKEVKVEQPAMRYSALRGGYVPRTSNPNIGITYNSLPNDNKWMIEDDEVTKVKLPSEKDVDISDRVYSEKIIIDENGNEHHEYYGTPKAIQMAKEKAASTDFKQQAAEMWRNKMTNEIYFFANELRRYDSKLAEDYLFMQHALSPNEFKLYHSEMAKKLLEFKSKDPTLINNGVNIGKDGSINITTPDFIKKMHDQAATAQSTLTSEERNVAEIMGKKSLTDQLNMIQKEKDGPSLIEKLHLISNMNIFKTSEEMEEYEKWKSRFSLNNIQASIREKYSQWKTFMRMCMTVPEGKTFDEVYDEWWNKPYNGNKMQKQSAYDLRMQRTSQLCDKLTYLCLTQPSEAQLKQAADTKLAQLVYQFDKGKIKDSESWVDFCNGDYGFGYMLYCLREEKLREQENDVRRKYNMAAYQNMVYDTASRNKPNSVPLSILANTDEYNKKRQSFLEHIFMKSPRGYL